VISGLIALGLFAPGVVRAHCDTLDGPVVLDAKAALAKGDVTPVLRWVKVGDEPAIREAFAKTIAVRGTGAGSRDLADQWFFETLVRVHRAGEGAPYTGLKPAGAEVDDGIALADRSLETRSIEALTSELERQIRAGIQARFDRVVELQAHADESVEAGRKFVDAYVVYIHFVERLAAAATTGSPHEHGAGHPAEEATGTGAHPH
jgi:hypothetical protein